MEKAGMGSVCGCSAMIRQFTGQRNSNCEMRLFQRPTMTDWSTHHL